MHEAYNITEGIMPLLTHYTYTVINYLYLQIIHGNVKLFIRNQLFCVPEANFCKRVIYNHLKYFTTCDNNNEIVNNIMELIVLYTIGPQCLTIYRHP